MSLPVALLTPGMSPAESQRVVAGLASQLGGSATILHSDPLSEEGRQEAQQALTTGRVDFALSSEAGFNPHVLPEAKVPVVVVARSPDMLWMAADVVAALRVCGVNASTASSWDDAGERIRTILSPPVLAGKKVLIETGSGFCRSMARVRIPDPERFFHTIAGCHYIMVHGNFVPEISRTLTKMNVSVIGPIAAHG